MAHSEAETAWRKANRGRILAYNRKYRERHPNGHNEWRAQNRDKVNACRRRYYVKNQHVLKIARTYGVSIPKARELLTEQRT